MERTLRFVVRSFLHMNAVFELHLPAWGVCVPAPEDATLLESLQRAGYS